MSRRKFILDTVLVNKQLTALDASIEHWKRMHDDTHGENESPIGEHCECCEQFWPADGLTSCQECPIALYAGRTGCDGTPYENAYKAWCDLEHAHFSSFVYDPNGYEKTRTKKKWKRESMKQIKFMQRVRAWIVNELIKAEKDGAIR